MRVLSIFFQPLFQSPFRLKSTLVERIPTENVYMSRSPRPPYDTLQRINPQIEAHKEVEEKPDHQPNSSPPPHVASLYSCPWSSSAALPPSYLLLSTHDDDEEEEA